MPIPIHISGKKINHSSQRTTMHGIHGAGMGSVLLNKPGTGSASSYSSVEDFKQDMRGAGLGGGLGLKIGKLLSKPIKKSQNIRFEL